MEAPFSLEEIYKVIFPDGFTMAFYQDNWESIKDDVWKVFCEFYERGVIDGAIMKPMFA